MNGLLMRLAFLVLSADGSIAPLQFVELFIGELFNVDHVVTGGNVGADQLVEL